MAPHTGTRLGPYEIVSALGAGGMGEVYRARDTKLNRDVAIKVLPDAFLLYPDRLARFKREAQVLASLNHPHIGAIYGFEESNGMHALVLELVEGPTLADMLASGSGIRGLSSRLRASGQARSPEPGAASQRAQSDVGSAKPDGARTQGLPLDEALPIARQIAEALEAAHEQGIIHRDLKPANIKVRDDGTAKVLDFGLAKLTEAAGSGPQAADGATASPTITTPAMMTGVGVILGTAAYMAPEQARGRTADKRSDVWAFGCVLYEMLTGTRAFEGEDVSDTLATVLKGEPDWKALPADLPPAIRALIRGCLAKDRRQRVGDLSTALFAIDQAAALPGPEDQASILKPPQKGIWRRIATHAGAALAASAAVAGVVWLATRPTGPPRVSRLQITPPASQALIVNGIDRDLAITPDGSRIVYVGANGAALFVRSLDQLDATAIAGVGAARGPFVSPDGQWIGFIDGITVLKKVAITGGPAITVGRLDSASRGATWGREGTIVFATANLTTGLQRISADGGESSVLTRPNRANGELDHLWPQFLPDGQAILFTITATTGGLDAASVAVLDLRTGKETVLVRGGSDARYMSSGHLVYAAGRTLRAIGFDLAHLTIVGTPVPIVPEVFTTTSGGADTAVASDGTAVYLPGGGAAGLQRMLVWVDRQGQEAPIAAPPRAYIYPRLAPDGTRIAVSVADQESDIWLWHVARATLTRVTFDASLDNYPVWTPDGRGLLFSSERTGARNLFAQAADRTGTAERLTESPSTKHATAVSPDGTRLIFTETGPPATGDDVMALRLDGDRQVSPLVQSPFTERNGTVSPDARWLAYEANDSGQFEIYVRPFPDVNGGHWQVSTAGGTSPIWAHSGQELFYLAPDAALMRVGVERGPTWAATTPTKLLEGRYFAGGGGFPGRTYDISPDDRRFLMLKAAGGTDGAAAPMSGLVVIQNWGEELKRLVPTK